MVYSIDEVTIGNTRESYYDLQYINRLEKFAHGSALMFNLIEPSHIV